MSPAEQDHPTVGGEPDITYAVADGVATITLNRPHRRNAFTLPMVDAWADYLVEAGRCDDVGAVVVTGGSEEHNIQTEPTVGDVAKTPRIYATLDGR